MTEGAGLARRAAGYPAVVLSTGTGRTPPPLPSPAPNKIYPIPSLAVNIKRTRRGEIAANGRLNHAWGLETVKLNILLTFPLICAATSPLGKALFSSLFFLIYFFSFWLGLAFRHHCM